MKRRKLLLALLPVIVVAAFTSGCTTISPGQVGIIVDNFGSNRGVQDYTLRTGFVAYDPISSSVIEYPTFIQTIMWTRNVNEGNPYDESITFTTSDDMVVNADVSLSYQLNEKLIPQFYVTFRSDDLAKFTNGFLHNVARDAFNNVGGKYTVESVMGDNGPFLEQVQKLVQKQVGPYGVDIRQFGFIGAPRPPQQVIAAINSKVQAQQIALQKQNEVLQSEADAKKAVAQAEGQAQSNRVLTSSITQQLIDWQKIQLQWQQLAVTDRWIARWDGRVPQVQAGQTAGFLLNIPAPKQ